MAQTEKADREFSARGISTRHVLPTLLVVLVLGWVAIASYEAAEDLLPRYLVAAYIWLSLAAARSVQLARHRLMS